jgi:NAD(P)H-nitrite reductase large subunit
LWLVYTQSVPVIFKPPCITGSVVPVISTKRGAFMFESQEVQDKYVYILGPLHNSKATVKQLLAEVYEVVCTVFNPLKHLLNSPVWWH